jgi:LysM repeat protein
MLGRRAAGFVLLCAATFAGSAVAQTDEAGRTIHTVYDGQTLGRIARRYHVTVEDLCHVNGIRYGSRIHPGQVLVIPDGNEDLLPKARTGHGKERWQDYVEHPHRRGVVTLLTPNAKWRGLVVTRRGKVLPRAQEAIEKMLASWRTGTIHDIDPRLIKLVVRVSDTFGGRPIRVVSGYREYSYFEESKHKVGHAFDFSIPGVPNAVVRDYLRTLPNVGVGYYPNSTHVHLDVREASAYWVDEAGPGEPPRFQNRGGTTTPTADTPDTAEASAAPEPANDDVRVQ